MDDYKHLSNASSLCGNCTEVCPVRINLHELLLENRHEAVEFGMAPLGRKNCLEGMENRQPQPKNDEHGQW